ncbi:photosystem II reaction center protein Ycf12/Psb30, partial [Planktothrix agardhii]
GPAVIILLAFRGGDL